jgi:ribosome-associated toxin RatA of RatAB toxin-antitoxin module
VGAAAEQGKSMFSQANKQVMEAFEKIAERIISRVEAAP